MNPIKILVIEDDYCMREMIEEFLRGKGYDCLVTPLATEALKWLRVIDISSVGAIVTDLQLPEMDGLELMRELQTLAPQIPVVVMTAFASIESAVAVTRQGAFAYLSKPFELEKFAAVLQKALAGHSQNRNALPGGHNALTSWRYGNMIGKSQAMQNVFQCIRKIAPAPSNVLITGASGTGKELVARAIHDGSSRKLRPFIAVNCSAIPEALLESELFGHIKGAFTGAIADKKGLFEEAHSGTLFLDEIGDLDASLQAKLLRVLQDKSVRAVGCNRDRPIDVRIIAATHKDLKQAIDSGQFREDLFYRLNVLPVHLAPLKDRREDIPLLAQSFLEKYRAQNNSPARRFSQTALAEMVQNNWSGNVRELENLVERLVVLATTEEISTTGLSNEFEEEENADAFYLGATSDWPTLEVLGQRYIEAVLKKTGGRKERAAQILGINRRTLYRREHSA